MSDATQIDYAALAQESGAISSQPRSALSIATPVTQPIVSSSNDAIDYNTLAQESGAISSAPARSLQSVQSSGIDYSALARESGAISSSSNSGQNLSGSNEGDVGKAWDWLNKPLIGANGSLLSYSGVDAEQHPVLKAFENFAEGLTSPLSIGLAATTFGVGAIEGWVAKSLVAGGLEEAAAGIKAASIVSRVKLAADAAFLSQYGYQLGTQTLPRLEMDWNDYKAAKTPEDAEKRLATLEQNGTEAILGAIATGLATKGVTNEASRLSELSSKGQAMLHTDYANDTYGFQSRNQVGNGKAEQLVRESQDIPEARRLAIGRNIEAGGDPVVLEQQRIAALAHGNADVKATAQQFEDAKNLTPEEIVERNKLVQINADIRNDLVHNLLLDPAQNQLNYLHHDIQIKDKNNKVAGPLVSNGMGDRSFLKTRDFPTNHDAEKAGFKPTTVDPYKLTAQYIQLTSNALAEENYAHDLAKGRLNDGSPIAFPGRGRIGYTVGPGSIKNGQPVPYVPIEDAELNQLQAAGKLQGLVDSGRVKRTQTNTNVTLNNSTIAPEYEYEWNTSTYKPVPLMLQKQLLQGELGGPGTVPVTLYVAPEVYNHLNGTLEDQGIKNEAFRKILGYSSQAKSALLSLSLFHYATIGNRTLEMAMNPLSKRADIDYFNLTPKQQTAVNAGVTLANPRRGWADNFLSEGVGSGGPQGNWVNRVPGLSQWNSWIQQNLFGSNGYIAKIKLEAFNKRIAALEAAYPDMKGSATLNRVAAAQVNNKFGGLNTTVLGRGLKTQQALRAILLAPDFLETTGRSIGDVAGKYGNGLRGSLVGFNVAKWFAVRAMNYAISPTGDTHPESGFSVLSPDGKKEYSVRSTLGDYLHFLEDPRQFAYGRVNPTLVRLPAEVLTRQDEYGHRISYDQLYFDALRQAVPIPTQPLLDFIPGAHTKVSPESTIADQAIHSVGVGTQKVFTPAEKLAMQLGSKKSSGVPLEGDALKQAQVHYALEDQLRSAILSNKADDIAAANRAIFQAASGPNATLTPEQVDSIRSNAHTSRLLSNVNRLSLEDLLQVYDQASQDEKKQLYTVINTKAMKWFKTAGRDKTPEQIKQMGDVIRQLPRP